MDSPTSSSAVAAAYVLSAFAFFAWLLLLPGLVSLDASDAAGNAMAQGFDAEAELAEAEQVVRAYQDSPERQAMLASLAALHRR